MANLTRTYLTISEYTSNHHRSTHILHNGWQWYHADFNNKKTMMELLDFFECTLTEVDTKYYPDTGKITFYSVSKDILSYSGRGFWTKAEAMERINGRRYKTFLGLSNGAIVTCYAVFNDNDTIEILRPNPNATEVYDKMDFSKEMEYRRNHWFL